MQFISVEENKNNMIIKHQELVRNARYGLSKNAIKILSLLVSMIKVSDAEFHQYSIRIDDFKELIGSDSKNTYKYVHETIKALLSNPIKIGDEQFNWVSYGKYEKGSNCIVFEVHRLLKPYLLELKKNFLEYDISNILLLKSTYVIRLYELCKDHLNEAKRYKNNRVTFDIKIERLKELFEIPESYLYKDIRVNILDKAVEQFKSKTDIQITYKEQKIGRKVDRILITVSSNNQELDQQKEPTKDNHPNKPLIDVDNKQVKNTKTEVLYFDVQKKWLEKRREAQYWGEIHRRRKAKKSEDSSN